MTLDPINASSSPEVQMNDALGVLDWSAVYGFRASTSSGLTWGYYGGRWGGFAISAATLALTNAADNYIVVARATGVSTVATNTTNWNNNAVYARVYKVMCAGGVVTAIEDHRAGVNGILITGGSIDGTAIGGATPAAGAFTTLSATGATNLDAGTVSAPGLYLEGETGTGLYRIGANNHGYAVSGAKVLDIASTGLAVMERLTISDATESTGANTGSLQTAGGLWVAKTIYTGSKQFNTTYAGNFEFVHRGAGGYRFFTDSGTKEPFVIQRLSPDNTLVVGTTGVAVKGELIAGANNTHDIGNGSVRWREIFATNGTINTSDARLKTTPRALTDAERAAALEIKSSIGLWQWLDAIEKKGDDARLHTGPTVQKCIEILESHGLDPFRYSFICHDSWEAEVREHPAIEARPATETEPAVEASGAWTETVREAGDVYSLRKDELILFLLAAA